MSTPESRKQFFEAFQFMPSPSDKPRLREVEQGIVDREVRNAYAEIRRRKDVLDKLLNRAKHAKGKGEFAEIQRLAQIAEDRVRDEESRRDKLIDAAKAEGFTPPVYRS